MPAQGVSLAELAAEPNIELPMGFGQRALVDDAFARNGLRRQINVEVMDIATIPLYVAHELGVAILPIGYATDSDLPVRALPLAGPELRLTLAVAGGTRQTPFPGGARVPRPHPRAHRRGHVVLRPVEGGRRVVPASLVIIAPTRPQRFPLALASRTEQGGGVSVTPRGSYPLTRAAGGFVFVSGTSSRRPDNTFAGAEVDELGTTTLDVRAQTAAVLDTIAALLAPHGCGLPDLVSATAYLVSMNDFGGYNEVWGRYFPDPRTAPTRTTVAVHQLPHPLLLVEISAVALAPGHR